MLRVLRALPALVFLLVVAIPAAPAATAEWRVDMRDHLFVPDELNITTGDSVTWFNAEEHDDIHTVDSLPFGSGPLNSGNIGRNESFTFIFSEPGNYAYFCKVHGFEMSGIVRVRDAGVPYAADDYMKLSHTPEGASGSVNVLQNDATLDEGETLTVTGWDEASRLGGTVECESSGECTYAAPAERTCPFKDSFEYGISDGVNTDTATVNIEVVCQPPLRTSIGLSLRRHLVARGDLSATELGCLAERKVKVQRRGRSGAWRTVAGGRAGASGDYKVPLRDEPGAYRAVAPRAVLESGQVCSKGVSMTRRHRHRRR